MIITTLTTNKIGAMVAVMSASHKIIITLALLLMIVLTVPSAVTAINIDQDDWTEKFNESDPGYSYSDLEYGENQNLTVAAFNVTNDNNRIRFKTNITDGTVDGLTDDRALQVYIDTAPEGDEGLDSETNLGGLNSFFEGLGSMNADYRIQVTESGVPVVQEHDERLQYNTVKRVESLEETDEQVIIEIKPETIGIDQLTSAEPIEAKYAYIDDPYGLDDASNYLWAPNGSVTLPQIETTKNAEVNATVEFGDEKVSQAASVDFILSDDDTELTKSIAEDQLPTSGEENVTFEPKVRNFEGTVELEVVVEGDDTYSIDRADINNTVEISSNGLDEQKYGAKIPLSIIEAKVDFGTGDDLDSDTSVSYTLDSEGTEDVGSAVDDNLESGDSQTNETFTVNPYDFDEEGAEVNVNVDDTDYPLDEAQGVDKIAVGESLSSASGGGSQLTFNADEIGHEFSLNIKESGSLDVGSDDGFTLNVSLESIQSNGGENISRVDHVINFDEELKIADKSQNVSYINTSEDWVVGENEPIIDNGAGTFEVDLVNSTDPTSDVVTEGNNETLYQIEFEFEDGLQDEMAQGDEGERTYSPSIVSEETNIRNLSANQGLSFTSTEDEITVRNPDTAITEATVTHRTEGSDMVGTPAKFDVEVNSNEGKLDKIMLNGTDNGKATKLSGQSGDNLVIDCGGASSCGTTEQLQGEQLQYTPSSDDTDFDGTSYSTFQFNITVVYNGGSKKFYIPSDAEGIDNSALQTRIYNFGDVDGIDGGADSNDLVEVLRKTPAESGGLPWGDEELAAADIDNDGEVAMNDVSLIYEYLN